MKNLWSKTSASLLRFKNLTNICWNSFLVLTLVLVSKIIISLFYFRRTRSFSFEFIYSSLTFCDLNHNNVYLFLGRFQFIVFNYRDSFPSQLWNWNIVIAEIFGSFNINKYIFFLVLFSKPVVVAALWINSSLVFDSDFLIVMLI